MTGHPHFGRTRHGLPVHARTADYHKGGFNKTIARLLTAKVGNMRCFWYFCVIALLSLPATLHLANVVGAHWLGIPPFFLSYGFIFLDAWFCQNFVQLVLLPALMVGQNLQNEASDARAAKQFEDLETVKDWLDLQTKGGLAEVLAAVAEVGAAVAQVSGRAGSNPAGAGLPADQRVVPPPAAPIQPTSEFPHGITDDRGRPLDRSGNVIEPPRGGDRP